MGIGVGTALLIGGGISAGGGILSSIFGGGAASKAASEQAAAIQQATQAEVNMYNQTVAREQPWVTAGTNALGSVQSALGIGPGGTGSINTAAFTSSPGYQFALGQGQGAINNQATMSGGPLSGNALRALNTFGTGQANNTFQTWLNNVLGVSNTGATAAANLGGIGANTANAISGLDVQGGNAAAAGTVGASNALTSGISGLTSNISNNALLYALLQGGGLSGALGSSSLPAADNPAAGATIGGNYYGAGGLT